MRPLTTDGGISKMPDDVVITPLPALPPQQRPAQYAYRPQRCNFVFICKVDADGSFLIGPETWTVIRPSVGRYVITHNLGHTKYAWMPVVSGTYRSVPTIAAFDEKTITVDIFDNNALNDLPFQVVMFTGQQ